MRHRTSHIYISSMNQVIRVLPNEELHSLTQNRFTLLFGFLNQYTASTRLITFDLIMLLLSFVERGTEKRFSL